MDPRLAAIVRLAKEGRRDAALVDLRAYLQATPADADAWVVLGFLAPDPKVSRVAYRRALDLNPQHAAARRALDALEARAAPESEAVSTSPAPAVAPPLDYALSEVAPESGGADHQAMRQARAVLWPFVPRGKHRPLGDLLDERQVTRQDLAWAAEEARSDELRQAARVILTSTHRLPDVGMAIQDARLIAWPYRRLNRPLGELVDAGMVQIKDLRRAAWFAKDARLREAARLLLPFSEAQRGANQRNRRRSSDMREGSSSQHLSQDAPTGVMTSPSPASVPGPHVSHPMVVIQGANYLADQVQRRVRVQAAVAAAIVTVFFAGLCGLLAYTVWLLANQASPPLWVLPIAAGSALLLYWLVNRYTELHYESRNFRRGQSGENRASQQLRHGLGGDWTLFRNVRFPGSAVDIDMVLLGPPGLFALEVKAYTDPYQYRGQHFYRRGPVGWRKMQRNPGKQARAGAGLLHAYIQDTLNQDVWVEPRLVWVGPGELHLQSPEVFVWFIERLDQETKRLRGLPPRLSVEERAALSGLLRGLCSTLR